MSPTVWMVYAPNDETDRRLSDADALLGARGYVRGRDCPDEVETAEPLRCISAVSGVGGGLWV